MVALIPWLRILYNAFCLTEISNQKWFLQKKLKNARWRLDSDALCGSLLLLFILFLNFLNDASLSIWMERGRLTVDPIWLLFLWSHLQVHLGGCKLAKSKKEWNSSTQIFKSTRGTKNMIISKELNIIFTAFNKNLIYYFYDTKYTRA